MCELFALSSREPVAIGFTLERVASRGGREGPHRDGWGVAVYEGADVFLLREPRAAAESELVRFIEHHMPPGRLLISHVRLATQGARALANTQPFQRELGGRTHVFAHNGDAVGLEGNGFTSRRFTNTKGLDSLQALFLCADPHVARGSGHLPCG